MSEQYKVWCPDMGEGEDDSHLIKAYDLECAAREYVEKSYHEEPFDCEMIVFVRGPYGELKKFSVYPEPTITFYSRELTL